MRLRLDPFSPHGVSVDNSTVTVAGGSTTTGSSVTVAGEDYLTLSAQEITANPIDLDNLSATGTPDSSTFLRGDNTWATPAGSGDVSKVGTPVNNQIGVWTGDGTIEGDTALTFDTTTDTLTTVNIAPSGTVDGRDVATDGTKLDGIEAGADVTDATNVDAAGATMNTDTSLAGNGYFLDEDNMASNSATKVPSQQSVKAYVDAVNVGTVDTVVAGNNIDVDATDPANPIVSVETLTLADISDVTASVTEVNYTDGVTSAIQTQIDGKQPLDSDLTTIAGLTATTDNFMVATASAWASRTPSQARTQMGLGSLATASTVNNDNWSGADLSVENGGTGRSTGTTAYSLIATGTTATGAQQTLANGATTEILVGGGASALPVWTTASGSGAPVRATSPTLTTPNLGTPSTLVLTNATGLVNAGLGTGATELGGAYQDWTANPTGFSSTTINDTRYKQIGKTIFCRVSFSGTSNATTFTFSLPTTSVNDGQTNYYLVRGKDSAGATTTVMIQIVANSSTATVFSTPAGGAWTASGTKILDGAVFTYETA